MLLYNDEERNLKSSLNEVKLFVLDVDGTMTDSGVIFDDSGREIKRFSSRDYVGAMAAHYMGLKLMVVTGRESESTTRRMKEMQIDYVFQNIKNKRIFLEDYLKKHDLTTDNIGYIGDDLNDYSAMSIAGFRACPSDAAPEIKELCDYVSEFKGGTGVLQDVFRFILTSMGRWDQFISEVVVDGY